MMIAINKNHMYAYVTLHKDISYIGTSLDYKYDKVKSYSHDPQD
jgi:hypothetical protein